MSQVNPGGFPVSLQGPGSAIQGQGLAAGTHLLLPLEVLSSCCSLTILDTPDSTEVVQVRQQPYLHAVLL
jgi:hypothetical protein